MHLGKPGPPPCEIPRKRLFIGFGFQVTGFGHVLKTFGVAFFFPRFAPSPPPPRFTGVVGTAVRVALLFYSLLLTTPILPGPVAGSWNGTPTGNPDRYSAGGQVFLAAAPCVCRKGERADVWHGDHRAGYQPTAD